MKKEKLYQNLSLSAKKGKILHGRPSNAVYVRIPENLELDLLVHDHAIQNEQGYKLDKLYYLCSIIFRNSLRVDKDTHIHTKLKGRDSEYFAPLKSTLLSNVLGNNYKAYLDFLALEGVIEVDNCAISDWRSNAFKIADKYLCSDSKRVLIQDFKIAQKIRTGQVEKTKKEHAHITDMKKVLPYLSMDIEAARERNELMKRVDFARLPEGKKVKAKKRKEILSRYNSWNLIIDDFESKQFFLKRNADHYRIYSTITSLPRGLRDLVRFKNEKLVQVDLSNAQFLMSTQLLNPDVWKNRSTDAYLKRVWKDVACTKAQRAFTQYVINLLEESQKNYGFTLPYTSAIMKGELYESFCEDFINAGHIKTNLNFKKTRKKAKMLIINSLFDNTLYGRHRSQNSVWTIFRNQHPLIVKIFDFIKFSNYKDAARLLQRIESIFMIDRVCKRLCQEHKHVPVMLLHDCVVTTQGNEALIDKIIKEEMINFLGFEGQTETKDWDSYKPTFYDFSKVSLRRPINP